MNQNTLQNISIFVAIFGQRIVSRARLRLGGRALQMFKALMNEKPRLITSRQVPKATECFNLFGIQFYRLGGV